MPFEVPYGASAGAIGTRVVPCRGGASYTVVLTVCLEFMRQEPLTFIRMNSEDDALWKWPVVIPRMRKHARHCRCGVCLGGDDLGIDQWVSWSMVFVWWCWWVVAVSGCSGSRFFGLGGAAARPHGWVGAESQCAEIVARSLANRGADSWCGFVWTTEVNGCHSYKGIGAATVAVSSL